MSMCIHSGSTQFHHLLKQAVIMAPVQAEATCCIGLMWNLESVIVIFLELFTDDVDPLFSTGFIALGLILVELLVDSGMAQWVPGR